MFTCVCACLCKHVLVCVCACLYVHVCAHMCTHTCTHVAHLYKFTWQEVSRAQPTPTGMCGRKTRTGRGGPGGTHLRRAQQPGWSPRSPRPGLRGRGRLAPRQADAGDRQQNQPRLHWAPQQALGPSPPHTQRPGLHWGSKLWGPRVRGCRRVTASGPRAEGPVWVLVTPLPRCSWSNYGSLPGRLSPPLNHKPLSGHGFPFAQPGHCRFTVYCPPWAPKDRDQSAAKPLGPCPARYLLRATLPSLPGGFAGVQPHP